MGVRVNQARQNDTTAGIYESFGPGQRFIRICRHMREFTVLDADNAVFDNLET